MGAIDASQRGSEGINVLFGTETLTKKSWKVNERGGRDINIKEKKKKRPRF